MAGHGKQKGRSSHRKDKGRKATLEPIPDTSENVIKALVNPVVTKKQSEKIGN